MPLPIPANNTCDIYRSGNGPPAAADVSGARCHLRSEGYHNRMERGESMATEMRWTHVLLVEADIDIRDNLADSYGTGLAGSDTVYVPDKDGALSLLVTFVERVRTPHDHKRVYLDRRNPTWPTSNL
jgi:hypothetical protein